MILTEQAAVPLAALPVAEFRDHLRLGTGFADDGLQDAVLEAALRAALAAIEGRTGKALYARSFLWALDAWRDLSRQGLPLAPVSAIQSLTIVDRFGVETLTDAEAYVLVQDTHRPALVSTGFLLPQIPVAGRAEILFDAGFGSAWADIPADLRQAVLMLAADYYERRLEPGGEAGWPAAVTGLLAKWRNIRLFGGLA
jgi:uncharacterized phiE125 gp8 family phage protein